MIILLGEVGGTEEYKVCDALKKGQLSKPLVAWCIGKQVLTSQRSQELTQPKLVIQGTCASMFTTEVQFGHAGSSANSTQETATSKNAALRAAGAHVPNSFDNLGL